MIFFTKRFVQLIFVIPVLVVTHSALSQDTLFVDLAAETGIQGEEFGLQFGVAWGDYDNDGDADLFVAADHENQLFQNNGDGTFTDVAEDAGVDDHDMVAIGGVWGDYDGDGDLDLYVVNSVAEEGEVENRLFQNNGDGTFTNVAEEMEVDGHVEDDHGHEDEHGHEDDVTPAQEDDHDHEEGEGGDPLENGEGFTGAVWADYDNDGDLDLLVTSRTLGVILYENHDGEEFHHVTEEAGLHIEAHEDEDGHDDEHGHDDDVTPAQEDDHEHEDEHEEEGGVGVEHASFGDFDNDGDLDLYLSVAVAHEHEDEHDHGHEDDVTPAQVEEPGHEDEHEEHEDSENRFFVNNGDGTFTDETDHYELGDPNESVTHSSVWGDFNNDGWFDLLVLNLGSFNEETAEPTRLFQNNGDGSFTDVAEEAGLVDIIYPLGAVWTDLNNDGWLDIAMINHPSHDDFQPGEFYDRPHPIFMNNGDGTFTNINVEAVDAILDTGVTDINHVVGLAVADYDNDGDIDYAVTENHGDGPFLLYTNQTAAEGNNWVQINVEQGEFNSPAVGARVELTSGDVTQYRIFGQGSTGFASQSNNTLHFGLGDDDNVELKVVWTDGSHEVFSGLGINQIHSVVQGEGTQTLVNQWTLH